MSDVSARAACLAPPIASPWRVLGVAALGSCVVSLDTTVNVALPAMTEALDAPISTLQWIIIAYVLTNTSLVLGAGRLADLLGRRRVWITGLFALAAALVGCGLARTIGQLVVARAFQATGAAMIAASGAALVTAAFPGHERGRALGLLAAGASAGSAAGPLLGGALVSAFGWQAVFLGRAPLALAAGLLALALLPRTDGAPRRERFDLLGAAVLALAMVALLLALNRGPLWGWGDARVAALALLAGALLGAFVVRERSFPSPVIDVRLFRSAAFAAANLAAMLSSLAMFGVWLLLPYYLVDGRGYSAVESGWFLACVPVASALCAPAGGWLADRLGARLPALAGLLIEAVGLGLIALLSADAPVPVVLAGLLVLGMGLGIFQAPNQATVMGSLPPASYGAGSGMLAMMRTLGVVTGVALLGAVYAAGLPDTVPGERAAFSVPAFRGAFAFATGVALLAALITMFSDMLRREEGTS